MAVPTPPFVSPQNLLVPALPNTYGQNPIPQPPAHPTLGPDDKGPYHPTSVTDQQRFLRSKGYDIAQDGIIGPETRSAWQAYLNGVAPRAWAVSYTKSKAPKAPARTPIRTPVPVNTPPVRTPASVPTPTPKGGGADPLQQYIDAMGHMIDPAGYAKAAAASAYDPRINAAVRSMAQAKAQQGADQADIAKWYSELVGQANASHASDLAAYHDLLGGVGDVTKGVVDSLGGSANPAAAEAAAQGQIGATELGGLGLADLAAVNARKDSFAKEGVGQRVLSRRAYEGGLTQAQGDLADLRAAKGNEYTKDLEDAYNLRASQAKNLMNAQMAAALAGPQLASQKLAFKQAQLNYDIDHWRYQMGIKQAAQGNSGGVPDFAQQDPTKLSSFLLQGTLGPRGNFNQNPADIYNRMAGMIKTVSYGKYDPASDPKVKNFLVGLVQSHLSAWNRQNPQNKFAIKGGKVVHI